MKNNDSAAALQTTTLSAAMNARLDAFELDALPVHPHTAAKAARAKAARLIAKAEAMNARLDAFELDALIAG